MKNTPFLLIINDGWGVAPPSRSNAITQANTPVFDHLIKNYWVETLQASGDAVGLPWGEMGNSEVGHLTIGAGKTIFQDLPRITKAIVEGTFNQNRELLSAIEFTKTNNSTLHIAGLISDGGVHSHIQHLFALIELAISSRVPRIALHCFLDGRDVPYNSALLFLSDIEQKIKEHPFQIRIATIAGRYFAMDRDTRWDRTLALYNALVYGEAGKVFPSAEVAVNYYYNQTIYDEQIPPTIIGDPAPIGARDALIFFNFRADRMRQLTSAFVSENFFSFSRKEYLKDIYVVTMTEYDKRLFAHVLFPEEAVTVPIAKVLSDAGVRQLHVAETEKYAHVTYFFNGGREESFPYEERILIPSPHVGNYAESPEMSAIEIGNRLLQEIQSKKYDFFVVNFANADMVGHTGNLRAAIAAIESMDRVFKPLIEEILAKEGVALITADHGNAEVMFDSQTGEINKEHELNPVPCVIVGKEFFQEKKETPDLSGYVPRGVLADVAPTILSIIGLPIPSDMTGHCLIE